MARFGTRRSTRRPAYLRLHDPGTRLHQLPVLGAFLQDIQVVYATVAQNRAEDFVEEFLPRLLDELLTGSAGGTRSEPNLFERLLTVEVPGAPRLSGWERGIVIRHVLAELRERGDLDDDSMQGLLARTRYFLGDDTSLIVTVRRCEFGSFSIELAPHAGAAATYLIILLAFMHVLQGGPDQLLQWLTLRQRWRLAQRQTDADVAAAEAERAEARARQMEAQARVLQAEVEIREAQAALARIKLAAPELTASLLDYDGREVPPSE